MTAWYINQPDELGVDVDRPWEMHHSQRWTNFEVFFLHRLLDAEKSGVLTLRGDPFVVESFTPGHIHAYVRLASEMSILERLTWQDRLGGDRLRSAADHMRLARGMPFPSILEEPDALIGFWRRPDRVCACAGKHKSEAYPDCEVWRELRGANIYELFGAPFGVEIDPETKRFYKTGIKPPSFGFSIRDGALPLDRYRSRRAQALRRGLTAKA